MAERLVFEHRVHVPRSQVWPGSRGGQRGNVHLHMPASVGTDGDPLAEVQVVGRIVRRRGDSLCGRRGWYERDADDTDTALCPSCFSIAERYQALWLAEHPPAGVPTGEVVVAEQAGELGPLGRAFARAADEALLAVGVGYAPVLVAALSAGWLSADEREALRPLAEAVAARAEHYGVKTTVVDFTREGAS